MSLVEQRWQKWRRCELWSEKRWTWHVRNLPCSSTNCWQGTKYPSSSSNTKSWEEVELTAREVGLVYCHHNCGSGFAANIQTSSAPYAAQYSGKACSGLTYVVTSTDEYRAIQGESSSFTRLQGNETANGVPCDAVQRLQQGFLSFQKSWIFKVLEWM